MCGICGVLCLDGASAVAESDLRRMVASQTHRGPDQAGFLNEPGIGFGFSRLAIIDLTSAGNQPMANEDGTVWLVFNGEIYNFHDIIPALERAGHRFRSRSDSEVIIHAYEEWGPACLERFNGMFAFALWDSQRQRVFIARDRLGVKPLYYWSDGHTFIFGSELKTVLAHPAVPRTLSYDALQAYLVYEYVPAPASIFTGIQKLPAGHYLQIELTGDALGKHTPAWTPQRYWNVQFGQTSPRRSIDEYAEELRDLLAGAVARRLISDVPLGTFLSGGIDSSIIVALMRQVSNAQPKTFSIGFAEQTFNELPYAAIVARHFNTDHHVEILRPNAADLIHTIATYLDEPFADASALPTYLVARSARQHVTVALSGDGGDELFAGYDWYRAQRFADQTVDRLPSALRSQLCHYAAHLPPDAQKKGWRNILRRMLTGANLPASLQHVRWQTFGSNPDLANLLVAPLSHQGGGADPAILDLFAASGSALGLDQQQYADIKRYLADDILFKVDRMSMAVSLEARGPFLDYTLVEFAARLPADLRLHGLQGKHLLKYAMRDILPTPILQRRKLGFNFPYKNWLRHELRELLQDSLAPSRLRVQGIFQPLTVQKLIREHLAGTHDHAHRLWSLLMFQLWADHYLTGGTTAIPTVAESSRLIVAS